MDLLPPLYVITVVGLLGLIIGSFLDVVVSRFHTGKSINGRSRCMSCGHTLSWYELFPLFSYLVLKGRCKNCGGYIPFRLLTMELSTSVLFVLAYISAPSWIFFFFSLVLISLLIVVASYDVQHMVIPNEFVIGALGLALFHLALVSSWFTNLDVLVPYIFSAIGASVFYAALWVVSKGTWIGLGDAKLAFPLGLMLHYIDAFSFVVMSFWIGAFVSIAVLLIQRILYSGKHRLPILSVPLTMKSEVPFAPFMIAAFILVYLEHINVLSIMTGLF
jgi:prepilin signal peptidase PulO-like enzyme (type II secretory pathway)